MNKRDYESSYKEFMSMEQKEWLGLIASLISGGLLEYPDEQLAFEDAVRDREFRDRKDK